MNVDVRVNSEVTAIYRKAETVTVKRHPDGSTYTESYDKLVLSPGTEPVRPPAESTWGSPKESRSADTSRPPTWTFTRWATPLSTLRRVPASRRPPTGPANKQGRICADNLVFGNQSEYKGAIATAVARVKLLKKEGIPFHSCVTHGSSQAGYYPGALAMTLKLLFSPKGKILGFVAQNILVGRSTLVR